MSSRIRHRFGNRLESNQHRRAGRSIVYAVRGRRRVRTNLQFVADLRGESREETAEQIVLNLLRSVPRRVQGYRVDFDELKVEESGVKAGYPWLRTTGGRTFYDHPATAR